MTLDSVMALVLFYRIRQLWGQLRKSVRQKYSPKNLGFSDMIYGYIRSGLWERIRWREAPPSVLCDIWQTV